MLVGGSLLDEGHIQNMSRTKRGGFFESNKDVYWLCGGDMSPRRPSNTISTEREEGKWRFASNLIFITSQLKTLNDSQTARFFMLHAALICAVLPQ